MAPPITGVIAATEAAKIVQILGTHGSEGASTSLSETSHGGTSKP